MKRNMQFALLPYALGLILVGLIGLKSPLFVFAFAKGITVYLIFAALAWAFKNILPSSLINERASLTLFFMRQPHAGIIIYVTALVLTIFIGLLDIDPAWVYYCSIAAAFGFHTVLSYFKTVEKLSV